MNTDQPDEFLPESANHDLAGKRGNGFEFSESRRFIANFYKSCISPRPHHNYISFSSTLGVAVVSLSARKDLLDIILRTNNCCYVVRTKTSKDYKSAVLTILQTLTRGRREWKKMVKLNMEISTLAAIDRALLPNVHKIGVIFQKLGQTTEDEILSNPMTGRVAAFLELLGYFGDPFMVDEFQLIFHISPKLPDANIAKKRLIGNCPVVLVLQEEGSLFSVDMFPSKVVQVYVLVQLSAAGVSSATAISRPAVPPFGPSLRQSSLRHFILYKLINASFCAQQTPQMLSLQYRARESSLLRLWKFTGCSMRRVLGCFDGGTFSAASSEFVIGNVCRSPYFLDCNVLKFDWSTRRLAAVGDVREITEGGMTRYLSCDSIYKFNLLPNFPADALERYNSKDGRNIRLLSPR